MASQDGALAGYDENDLTDLMEPLMSRGPGTGDDPADALADGQASRMKPGQDPDD